MSLTLNTADKKSYFFSDQSCLSVIWPIIVVTPWNKSDKRVLRSYFNEALLHQLKKRWHWVSLKQLQTVSNVSGNRTCRALRTGGPLLRAAVWANTLRPNLHFFPHLMGFILHVRCISFVGEPAVASLYFCSELVSSANAPQWGVPGFVDSENKPTSPTQIQSPLINASEVHFIIHLHCEVVAVHWIFYLSKQNAHN